MNSLIKDNFILGMAIGLLVPVLCFAIILGIENQIMSGLPGKPEVPMNIMVFIAIATNLLPFRFYMINKKLDKTGRGILLATFVFAFLNVLYIVLNQDGSFF
jgi:hypothetical protein